MQRGRSVALQTAGLKSWVLRVLPSLLHFPAPRLHGVLLSSPTLVLPSRRSLEGITKRFKFTAVKQAPGTAAGGSGARSKAERKAAAAGAARKGER